MSREISRVRKRHFLLLEVLIALGIVLVCIVPMLQPHLAMLMEEKRFIREVELDRVANVLYCDLLVNRFYRSPPITWEDITSGRPNPLDSPELTRLGYTGSYMTAVRLPKKQEEQADSPLDLLKITFTFNSSLGGTPIVYNYDLFIQRTPNVEEKEDEENG